MVIGMLGSIIGTYGTNKATKSGAGTLNPSQPLLSIVGKPRSHGHLLVLASAAAVTPSTNSIK